MGLRPIKLQLDGEEIHLVPARALQRWTGYLNARRAAYTLVTPENVSLIRAALLTPPWTDTEGVFTELRKQLEDGSALFFEVPPQPVVFDAPQTTDLVDLLPGRGGDDSRGTPDSQPGLHWVEVVCVSPQGEGYAGARGRMRLPDGRNEFVTLDARSSVRFDDLTEGGTVHFELSGDAVPSGTLGIGGGLRYELGASVGLTTRKRHVLVIHPNPNAFVSVELLLGGEPVLGGQYTLSTKAGEQAGELRGEVVRAQGFVLPSSGTYAFEGVIVPPRAAEEDAGGDSADDAGDDSADDVHPSPVRPTGGDSSTYEPTDRPSDNRASDEVRCLKLEGACFGLNKSFMLPSALEGVRILRHVYEEAAFAGLLLVGHTDSSGSGRLNLELSLERAEALAAFLEDDAPTWVAKYDSSMPASRRWGESEDLAMLSVLPRGQSPYYAHGVRYVAAIEAFQRDVGLRVDGEAGPKTRGALVREYMAADGTSLPASVRVVCHGCGSAFPLLDAPTTQPENRRVEAFFFAESIQPQPESSTSGTNESLYPAWNGAVEKTRTFRPSEGGLGSLDVYVDAHAPNGIESVGYRLTSTDELYDVELQLRDAHFEAGHGVLVFEGMPRGSAYSLTVTELDGRKTVVFEDVAFERLDELSDALDDEATDPLEQLETKDQGRG